MPTKYEKRNLYKLILARSDITSALFTCRYCQENVKDIRNKIWLPLQEAIIVTYSRPFTDNKPLGSLKKSWGIFPNGKLQSVHKKILEARDKQIAHSDLEQNKVSIVPKGVPAPPDNHISSSVMILISSFKFPLAFFEDVEILCSYIGKRLNIEIDSELERLYGKSTSTEKFDLDIETDNEKTK